MKTLSTVEVLKLKTSSSFLTVKPLIRIITECRSFKFQSGILNKRSYVLPEYCVLILFSKKYAKQLAYVLLMLKNTDISFYVYGQNFHQNAKLRGTRIY